MSWEQYQAQKAYFEKLKERGPAWKLQLGSGWAIESTCEACEMERLCGRCRAFIFDWLLSVPRAKVVWPERKVVPMTAKGAA